MAEFTFTIDANQLARGLRPSKRIPRNAKYLVESKGAVGRDGVLAAVDNLSRINTEEITDTFPFPQLFVFTNIIIVCSQTKIYEWVDEALVEKLTVEAGSIWAAVDFYGFVYMSNGVVAVIRSHDTGNYSETTELPLTSSILNYNGQVVVGAANPGLDPGPGPGPGPGPDPDILFFWRCESQTLDAVLDYSAGDQEASYNVCRSTANKVGTYGLQLRCDGEESTSAECGSIEFAAGEGSENIISITGGRIGAWVYLDAEQVWPDETFFIYMRTAALPLGLRWTTDGNCELALQVSPSSFYSIVAVTDNSVPAGAWHFIEAAWKADDGYAEIFVNGVSKGVTTELVGGDLPALISLNIGHFLSTQGYYGVDQLNVDQVIVVSNSSFEIYNSGFANAISYLEALRL